MNKEEYKEFRKQAKIAARKIYLKGMLGATGCNVLTVEDLEQEALIAMWQAGKPLQVIAYRRALTGLFEMHLDLRACKVIFEHTEVEDHSAAADDTDPCISLVVKRNLARIEALPQEARTVVEGLLIEKKTSSQIAKELGISNSSLSQILHAILHYLIYETPTYDKAVGRHPNGSNGRKRK